MIKWTLSIIFNLAIVAIIIVSAFYTLRMRKNRDEILKTFSDMHSLEFTPATWRSRVAIKGTFNHYPIILEVRREPGRHGRQYLYGSLTTQKSLDNNSLISLTARPTEGTMKNRLENLMHSVKFQTEKWSIHGQNLTANPLSQSMATELDAASVPANTDITVAGNTVSFEMWYTMPTMVDLENLTSILLLLARGLDQGEVTA